MNLFEDFDIYDDGWMFLLGGSNNVRDYWIEGERIPVEILASWLKVFINRVSFFEKNNIRYLNIFAPEKLSIYKEKVPFEVRDDCIPSRQLFDYFKGKFDYKKYSLDLIPYLRSQSRKYKTYHKTDSHWNFIGAFCAYQLIQSKLGEPVYHEALSQPRKYGWGVLDLGGKLDPPLRENVFYYQSSQNIKRVFANELVEFKEREKRENDPGLHVGSYVIYRNAKPLSKKVVLIFGDSFSEYRDHLLTGLMAETYSEVHFSWGSSIDYSLIEDVRPDIVIAELAERFISKQAPNDSLLPLKVKS